MRAAHTGIAVGSGEASVAAPFSTKENTSIAWVPAVFRCPPVIYQPFYTRTRAICTKCMCIHFCARREGRCTMAAAFSLFKYMTFHSCTQYFAMNSLYLVSLSSLLPNLQIKYSSSVH